MRNLANNLRDEWNIFRHKYKKTQSQASLELGWSASLFNQFLCGRRPINSEHIIKISNYFDISPDTHDQILEVDFAENSMFIGLLDSGADYLGDV